MVQGHACRRPWCASLAAGAAAGNQNVPAHTVLLPPALLMHTHWCTLVHPTWGPPDCSTHPVNQDLHNVTYGGGIPGYERGKKTANAVIVMQVCVGAR